MVHKPNTKPVLVILGPTASGKTTVALHAAGELGGEIISADARQIYKFLNIGTAKPSKADLDSVRHHFVDELRPDQDFNAGEFGKRGRRVIGQILKRGKVPIVAGGSGLYIQALIDGFFEGPTADPSVRESFEKRLARDGEEALLNELRMIDPQAAAGMLPTNTRRIIRALEVHQITGERISDLQKKRIPEKLDAMIFGLDWERNVLYKRIEERVDRMIADGLIDEVEEIIKNGYRRDLNALQTVGYAEVFRYLEGEFSSARMIELIKQNSRRYAKRQMTWFRKDKRIKWFGVGEERDLEGIGRRIVEEYKLRMET